MSELILLSSILDSGAARGSGGATPVRDAVVALVVCSVVANVLAAVLVLMWRWRR